MRRLWALVTHLPADSAYRRATGTHWTDELELAATQAELTHLLTWVTARAYGHKGRYERLHVPRPNEPRRSGLRSFVAAMRGGS